MTMNTRPHPLSDADWERLSAYLDGALPPAERRAVEARLAHDPAWQAARTELLALRAALRDLPPPRRPRSFVLMPEMVRPRARRGWLPRRHWASWGLAASAVAVLALFAVVGGWVLRGGGVASQAAPMPPAAAVAEEPHAAPRLEMAAAPEAVADEDATAEALLRPEEASMAEKTGDGDAIAAAAVPTDASAEPDAAPLRPEGGQALPRPEEKVAPPFTTAPAPTPLPRVAEPTATAAQPGRSRSPFPQINPLGLTGVCALALAVGLGVGWWASRRRG